MEILGKASQGRDFLSGLPRRLEPQTEAALRSQAERDLARRSVFGSLAYFVVTLTAAYGTPYGSEHPDIIAVAAAITGILGATRLTFGIWLAKASGEALFRWRVPFRASILGLFIFWGLFSALTLELYQFSWTTMLVLFATSALAGGGTSSLAPSPRLGRACLISIILPAIVWSAWHGEREGYSLVVFGTIYLAFVLVQIRQHWEVYRSTSVAAALEAKRESDKLFRTVFEAAHVGMGLVTPEGRFSRVNNQLCVLLNKTEEELLAVDLQTFFPAANLPGDDGRNPALRDSPSLDFEHEFERSTGEKAWLSATLATVGGRTHELRYYVLLVRDVSERKQAELERKKMEARLWQAQKLEAMGVLAGGMAHDYNNLMAIAAVYADLLASRIDRDDPLSREAVDELRKVAERATSLGSQLLAFGRRQALSPQVFGLNAVVSRMEKMLQRLLGEDVELITRLKSSEGFVKADPGQIEQAILLLAANARDAMPRGGTLVIETAEVRLDRSAARRLALHPGPYVTLAVRDTGKGMDAETRSRVFEPFFTTKNPSQGTGLGLATVYGVVKKSGGTVWVESLVGEGTTLTIYLPQSEEEVQQGAHAPVDKGALRGEETILLVEDEPALRNALRVNLERLGYHVLAADDGDTALSFAADYSGGIDMLLTDVVMPRLSGRAVAERLLSERPTLKVLYMSGHADRTLTSHGVEECPSTFLSKPFPTDVLARKIREVLASA